MWGKLVKMKRVGWVVFLTFCTMVTLYFAKEVPLAPNQHIRLPDVDPLLEDPQAQLHGHDHTESKPWRNAADHKAGNRLENVFEIDTSERKADSAVNEDQVESFSDSPSAVLVNLLTSLRHLPLGMHSVLTVMALTWLSWFPFFLFDTDWMGREVYHGDPKGSAAEIRAYDDGVREGAFGLLLNSCFFLVGSGGSWYQLFPLACSLLRHSRSNRRYRRRGQGLAIGVLNLAIVLPQVMIVSLGAGLWDALFGGGYVPAFVLASLSALAAGIIATLKLPTPS
ncbi:hypothetical protein Hanom_Chr17g01549351 [Helianthus anomalus]